MHWDGEFLPEFLSKENVEACDEEQLIRYPVLENNKGIFQAKAELSAIEQWGTAGKMQAMWFDTTAVNHGGHRGTSTVLKQIFEKNLFYLACRHYILEVVLNEVFNRKMGRSTAPQLEILSKFQNVWSKLDKINTKQW